MTEISFAAEAMLGWLLTYLLHSTLIVGAAALICKRAAVPVALRDLLWKAALLGGALPAPVQVAAGLSPLAGAWSLAGGAGRLAGWVAPAAAPA
ncbi:MAG: hypothetical protein ICV87_06875, partial [Gemmatimonadetes bacterium]|nr:hypothetical protein [Gemmatimonadota bacterium]